MSGLGGNLTYPDDKQFRNSFGVIANPGGEGQEFRVVADGALDDKMLYIESAGNYIPSGSHTKTVHKAAVSKVADVVLSEKAPCDECNAELGFVVVAVSKKPGQENDNLYGQRRVYAHKFKTLDPVSGGLLSDADMMRAYADISQQILDDQGRFNGNGQGNTESVVDGMVTLKFSASVAGKTYDIPAAGLYGVTLTAAAAYIDSPLAKSAVATIGTTATGADTITMTSTLAASMYVGQSITLGGSGVAPTAQKVTSLTPSGSNIIVGLSTPLTHGGTVTVTASAEADKVVNNAVGITKPGYGFIVNAGSVTLTTHKIALTTKPEYRSSNTFQLEDVDGRFDVFVAGSFELLPWDEVFREFTHMAHDVPLSNFHDVEKPMSTYPWVKYTIESSSINAGMHGASAGTFYLQRLVLFLPDNGATTGNAGCIADFDALLAAWES